ncbi:MAG TPA: hypothetical protein PK018_02130 [Candidatus Competibacter sp.]|nr:hypothetical protein [Candidatus Competibacter sp.]
MKTGDKINFAVTSYLTIGVVIGLTQFSLNQLFEPPCSGIVKHTLWKRGDSGDTHFLWQVGSNVVQWLPDLYSTLVKGDMTVRDYLLGGYHCEPNVVLRPSSPTLSNNPLLDLSRITISGGPERRSEIPLLLSKPLETSGLKGTGLGGDRPHGSLSEVLVKQPSDKTAVHTVLVPSTSTSALKSLLIESLPQQKSESLETSGLKGTGLGGDRPPHGSLFEALVKQPSDKTAAHTVLVPSTSTSVPKSLLIESLPQRKSESPLTMSRNFIFSDEMVKPALKPWENSSSTSAKQSILESQFVTIEAFPGVSLSVPRDWQVVDSKETQQLVTASEAVYGIGQGISKTENVRVFQPPTAVEGVSIAVISMPVSLPQQEWRTANDAQLHEWASVFTQQARRGIEAQGFKLLPLADFSRELIGDWLGISFKMRIVDTEGTVFEQAQICVPTTSRTIVLNLSYGKDAPPIFRPILAHARETLRIVEARKP